MVSAHATHPGLVRQANEDCVRADDNLGVYLLADGIGGHNAGEVASALAVETVHGVLRSNLPHSASDGYFELLVHAVQKAHWEIYTKALSDPACAKMGTTLVAVILRDGKAYIAHAGDSRCYLFSRAADRRPVPAFLPGKGGSTFRQLTRDHTVGDSLLASGISLSQIPEKQFHTLTQSVGCGDPPYPDFTVVELAQDDLLLICSDGLTDMLADAEIETILAAGGAGLEEMAAALIAAANANGGRDNISVVLVAPPENETGGSPDPAIGGTLRTAGG